MLTSPLLHSWTKRLSVLLGSLLIALPVLTHAAPEVPETPARGVLWEVQSGTNTAYLFGSIHLAKASFYPLPARVEAAYRQADTLAVELDASDPDVSAKAMPYFTYRAPDKLENHLNKTTWQSLQALVGPASVQFQTLKPAVAATALSMGVFAQQGYDPAQGIDLHFIRQAKVDKKAIRELESMEFQAQVLGGLSDEDGDALLQQTLDGLKSGEAVQETEAMIAAWKRGDADTLIHILQETASKDAGSKKLMKLLLDDRNPRMAQQIADLLHEGKKVFVVVGAGHIAGTNSITDILQKQGLQIRQIK